MKLRHAAAFALVVALGCLAPGCTRHPSWRVVQAPLKPCGVGPSDPAFLGYLNHGAQCFDLAAPLSKWCSVGVGRWPFKRGATFDDQTGCLFAIYGRDPWPVHSPYMCIRADDPRLVGQKLGLCTCIYYGPPWITIPRCVLGDDPGQNGPNAELNGK